MWKWCWAAKVNNRCAPCLSCFHPSPIAMIVIFALLAIPLKSYTQPLIIMSVIPFGAIGAIVGHFIMGANLVFFSMLGIIALSGVVVNASLVLVVNINRLRARGYDIERAVTSAGIMRFRTHFPSRQPRPFQGWYH